MAPAVRAGLLYFAVVFMAGFALGTLRVLVLAPALGDFASVLAELPVILAIAWVACRRIVARLGVPATVRARAAMGGVAFAMLIGAEALLGAAVFGRPLASQAADLASPAGSLGLAGQIGFALLPLVQFRR